LYAERGGLERAGRASEEGLDFAEVVATVADGIVTVVALLSFFQHTIPAL